MFQTKTKEPIVLNMSSPQQELLETLETNLETGLTTDQASQRREQDGAFNVVRPPVDCPSWLCIILPCIKNVPSMKSFAAIRPEDAEVKRNGKWVRYDASSLVKGDIIRMEEGDFVPGDCVVLQVQSEEEVLVDSRSITGEERLKSVAGNTAGKMVRLYYGGKVVQGSAMAVITAIGPNTLLSKLIREKRFPPKEPVLEAQDQTKIASIV
jgi:magnesium-transporting ATPase (P-type)